MKDGVNTIKKTEILREELDFCPPVMKDDRVGGGVGPSPRIGQPG